MVAAVGSSLRLPGSPCLVNVLPLADGLDLLARTEKMEICLHLDPGRPSRAGLADWNNPVTQSSLTDQTGLVGRNKSCRPY